MQQTAEIAYLYFTVIFPICTSAYNTAIMRIIFYLTGDTIGNLTIAKIKNYTVTTLKP